MRVRHPVGKTLRLPTDSPDTALERDKDPATGTRETALATLGRVTAKVPSRDSPILHVVSQDPAVQAGTDLARHNQETALGTQGPITTKHPLR